MNALENLPWTMADLFPRQHVVAFHQVQRSVHVVEAMVDRLITTGRVRSAIGKQLVESLMRREEYGTSAIGNRLAFPHLRTPLVENVLGCFAYLDVGCDFLALDGQPTRCFWLTVAPVSRRREHIAILTQLFRLVRDPRVQLWMDHPQAAMQIWQHANLLT